MATDKMMKAAAKAWHGGDWHDAMRASLEAAEQAREVPAMPTQQELATRLYAEHARREGIGQIPWERFSSGMRKFWMGHAETCLAVLAQRLPAPQPVAWTREMAAKFAPNMPGRDAAIEHMYQHGLSVFGTTCPTVFSLPLHADVLRIEQLEAGRDDLQRRLDKEAAEHLDTLTKCERCTQHWMARAEKAESRCTELDRERADAVRYLATAQERVRELEAELKKANEEGLCAAIDAGTFDRVVRQRDRAEAALADTKARLKALRDACMPTEWERQQQESPCPRLQADRLQLERIQSALTETAEPAPQPVEPPGHNAFGHVGASERAQPTGREG